MIPKHILAILASIISLGIYSQSEHIEFDYLRVEDGVPHSTINDVIQDSLGYIWIATDDGVAYYDNYNFRVFRHNKADSNSIVSNQIYKLHIDPDGKLWVGTKQSLELYDEAIGGFRHFYILNSPKNERIPIIEITQINDSILLLGTDGGGLRYFNTNNFSNGFFLSANNYSKLGWRISSVFADKFGRHWIGTLNHGLFLYFPDSIENPQNDTLVIQRVLHNSEIRRIISLNSNELLVATYGEGIVKIDIKTLHNETFSVLENNNDKYLRVFDICGIGNQLFIGTDGEGLIKYDIKTKVSTVFKDFGTHTKSISNNVIRTVFIDKEKSLWLGHFQGGISLSRNKNPFNNIKFSPFSKISLSHSNVTTILVDSYENTWIGTDGGGLNIINEVKIYNSLNKNLNTFIEGEIPNKILSLFEDNERNIWIGTYLDGVYVYNPKSKKIKALGQLYPELTLSNSDIRCINQDRKGNIWIGTNGGGVNILDIQNQTLKILKRNTENPHNSLSLDWIRTIHEDNFGYIWIGTTYGLNVYDPIKETFRMYLNDTEDSSSISGNFIHSLTEDSNGQIWVGTSSGLNKYYRKTDQFQSFTEEDGLPGDIINSIICLENGNLWISTNYGISNYLISNNKFKNYNSTDGLASNSFLTGAFYDRKKELLYFGSVLGLTYFNPEMIKEISYEIPVILTELKVLNQTIKVNQEFNKRIILKKNIAHTNSISLLQKENVITIEFAALSYSYTDKIEYEYRLLGFSNSWNRLTADHAVTYTNLASGTYDFQIRVRNLGAKQPTRNLEIIVLPPFHETIWFKILVVAILLVLALLYIQLKIKNIKRQRDLLKQQYEIEKLASEKERTNLNTKIQEAEIRFRKDEMNYKNSQLISTAMLLTHKNERMNEVKNKISAFLKEVQEDDLKKKLINLINTINSEFKVEEDWNRFEAHFNNIHKDFMKRIKVKYPDLSLTYLRLCAYLKLELSTKEIASLMNISQRGVEKARSRLRKMLSLDPGANLVSFITKL